jgi:hypothetical protein
VRKLNRAYQKTKKNEVWQNYLLMFAKKLKNIVKDLSNFCIKAAFFLLFKEKVFKMTSIGALGSTTVTLTSGTGGTSSSSLVTTEQFTGLISFAMGTFAAVFAVAVTLVALYGLDVMSRANKLTTTRRSSPTAEG